MTARSPRVVECAENRNASNKTLLVVGTSRAHVWHFDVLQTWEGGRERLYVDTVLLGGLPT
jgi:hypothetical protein